MDMKSGATNVAPQSCQKTHGELERAEALSILIEPGGVYGGCGAIFAAENPIFQSKNRYLAVFAPGNLKDFSKNW